MMTVLGQHFLTYRTYNSLPNNVLRLYESAELLKRSGSCKAASSREAASLSSPSCTSSASYNQFGVVIMATSGSMTSLHYASSPHSARRVRLAMRQEPSKIVPGRARAGNEKRSTSTFAVMKDDNLAMVLSTKPFYREVAVPLVPPLHWPLTQPRMTAILFTYSLLRDNGAPLAPSRN